jgi:hypothetical protein
MRAFEQTDGLASITAWDQSHAEAIESLRGCRAFVLVTLAPDSGHPTFHALSRDMTPEGLTELLREAAGAAWEAAESVPCENEAA